MILSVIMGDGGWGSGANDKTGKSLSAFNDAGEEAEGQPTVSPFASHGAPDASVWSC